MFEPKDFENLYRIKITDGFSPFSNFDICTSYFANIGNKFIFIKKSRRIYKIVASANCGFQPLFRESCFDVIYHNTDLNSVVDMFNSYVSRLLIK